MKQFLANYRSIDESSQLTGLTDAQRAVIEGYALLNPERPARTKMLGWVNRVRKAEGKTGFTSEQFREAIESLITAGLLLPSISGSGGAAQGPTVVPGLVSPGCLAALEVDRAYTLLGFACDQYEYMFTRYGTRKLPDSPGQLELLLREDVFDFSLLEQYTRLEILGRQFDPSLESRLPDNIWSWMVEPVAHPYVIDLPQGLRQRVCLSGLSHLCLQLQPTRSFRELCLQHAPDPLSLIGFCATTLIFEGEFKQARALLSSYAGSGLTPEQSKRLQVATFSNEALIATLTGNAEHVRKNIDACMDAERAGTRRRNVFPVQPAFEIAVLGLLLDTSPQSLQLFNALVKTYSKLRVNNSMGEVYSLASRAIEEHYVSPPRYRESEYRIVDLFLALSSRWHEKFNLSAHHETFVDSLQHLLLQTEAAGYQWVVAELLKVLEESTIGKTSRLPQAEDIIATQSSAERHKQLGTTSLTSLVRPLDAWEINLRNLELLVPAEKPLKNPRAKPATIEKRVVWQLLELGPNVIEAVPLAQTKKKTSWSAGRRISLQKLKNNPEQVDGLSTPDHMAAATIRKVSAYGWGGGSTRYETDSRTVYQLIGHALVIDENLKPVDVVEQSPVLRITENGDSVRLQIYPEPTGQHYVANFEAGSNRVCATHFNAAQRRLSDVIPAGGLDMPLGAKSRLLQVAASLSGDIQVQSDMASAGASSIEGDATPLLQLEIVGNGVRVRFKVEPLADSGILYDSGVGGAVVYISKDGQSVAVSRNLQSERKAMLELLDQIPQIAICFDGQHSATIDNTVDALEMLDQVNLQEQRCVWVNDKSLTIVAHADSNQLRLRIKSAQDWFSASGELKVNEDAIHLSRLVSLLRNQPQSRFVELGSGEFLALSAKLRSQLQVLSAFSKPLPEVAAEKLEKSDGNNASGVQRLHPLAVIALGVDIQDSTFSPEGGFNHGNNIDAKALAVIEGDKRWDEQLERVRQALAKPPELPSTLQADLRDYQLRGYRWLSQLGMAGAGACLADDMGLGKTLQSLAVLVARAAAGSALVIAPTSVTGNWLEEARRFAPTLDVCLYSEIGNTSKKRQKSLKELRPFRVVVASYGLLASDCDAFAEVHWHTVVLDEAQAIKNASTKRAKAARRLQADMRIATTGTPIQNNLMDLHSLFEFLNPGVLGSRNEFHRRFVIPIERDASASARQELQVLTTPFILRRLKRDVLKDLPSRTEISLSVELSEEEATLYETLRLEALESLNAGEGAVTAAADYENADEHDLQLLPPPQRFAVLAQLMRLRRLCCNPKLIESDWSGPQSKLDLFNDTLHELLAGRHKVLVFSQFVDHLQLVEAELKKNKISYQYLDGSTPAKKRQHRVSAFQSGEGDVFLISLTAGGTGLNLTAADYVIHLDPWWNPAVEDQASDRAHRIGQQRPVTIYRMVTKGTIEAQIQELHSNKRELAQSILSGADNAKVDPERLLELLAVPFGT